MKADNTKTASVEDKVWSSRSAMVRHFDDHARANGVRLSMGDEEAAPIARKVGEWHDDPESVMQMSLDPDRRGKS